MGTETALVLQPEQYGPIPVENDGAVPVLYQTPVSPVPKTPAAPSGRCFSGALLRSYYNIKFSASISMCTRATRAYGFVHMYRTKFNLPVRGGVRPLDVPATRT
eukprot:SAG31_NODE_159_length_21911_cov_12.220750_24_plen_104_part_00